VQSLVIRRRKHAPVFAVAGAAIGGHRELFGGVMCGKRAETAAAAHTAAGIETYLIRQTQSDCNNSNVNANNPSLIGGVAFVARQNNGNTYVKVEITGTPNTTYNVYRKCVGQLGTIATQDGGIGFGVFDFQTNSGTVVAFDMYPNGSPPGNTFQSVPITVE
jgi:hypothetical protein